MNSSSSAHHQVLPPHPHFHYLQLTLVQVDALEEQAMCGIQDNNDNAPDPSHVPMARNDTSGSGSTLNKPSSWHEDSVGVSYLHLEGDGRMTSSLSTLGHVPQPWCCSSCCHIVTVMWLLHHFFLKVKAFSAMREMLLCYRALCHLVI